MSDTLGHLVVPDQIAGYAAAATFEAHDHFGVPLEREAFEQMALGASWVALWADQMLRNGDLTEVEHGKLRGAAKAAASMWAAVARAQETVDA